MNAQRADRLSLPADPVCEQATLSIWKRVSTSRGVVGDRRNQYNTMAGVSHPSRLAGLTSRILDTRSSSRLNCISFLPIALASSVNGAQFTFLGASAIADGETARADRWQRLRTGDQLGIGGKQPFDLRPHAQQGALSQQAVEKVRRAGSKP